MPLHGLPKRSPGGIGRPHGVHYQFRRHSNRFVVYGLTRGCGSPGHSFQQLTAGVAYTDVGKCHGKTYARGKCEDFVDGELWLRLEHELSDEPERNFFAVHVFMRARRGGKTVMNGVGRSKT